MKRSTKRLLSLLMALAMLLSLLPVMAFAATPETLYLKPNSNWTQASARFAAYFFGNGEKWVSMTDSDGDGVYEVAVPSGYPNVIFCRMNPGTTVNNWNNKWNQTGDLTVPTNGNNCFTIPAGSWDSSTTGWGTYTPPAAEAERDVTIHFQNTSAWDTVYIYSWIGSTIFTSSWPGSAMTAEESHDNWYTYTVTGVPSSTLNVIFNNNSSQTSDLTLSNIPETNAEYWYTGSFTDTAPDSWTSGEVVSHDVTVHYLNANAWENVNIYGFDNFNTPIGAEWPGSAMTAEEGHPFWYSTTIEGVTASSVSVVFNNGIVANEENDNGAEQTSNYTLNDISDESCEYWIYHDHQYGEEYIVNTAPDIYGYQVKEYDVTVHFANFYDWENVYLYSWTDMVGIITEAWPGTALTQDDNGYYSTNYTAQVLDGRNLYFIFADGTGNQTDDICVWSSELQEASNLEFWIKPIGEVEDEDFSTKKYYSELYSEPLPIEATVGDKDYFRLQDALNNANGQIVTLQQYPMDCGIVNQDLVLDLNGWESVTFSVAEGATLYLLDSSKDENGYCTGRAYVSGDVAVFTEGNNENYLVLENSNWEEFAPSGYKAYYVHRYDVALTHISLDPNNDALGYKAELYGDETVQKYVTAFGFNLWVDETNVKTYSKTGTQNLTLRLKNILASNGGEMAINANAFVTLTVGEETYTKTCGDQTTTMKDTLQAVNSAWDTYSDAQQAAVRALYNKYKSVLFDWELDNISGVIDIPIT